MRSKRQFEKSGLGKSLINAKAKQSVGKSSRHTTALNDGSDYGKLNLRSVTQETSLDEFITIAQMANESYAKDHENVTIITKDTQRGVINEEEKRNLIKAQEKNKEIIAVPRRPPWDPKMSAEDLTRLENDSFLDWRRKLAQFQESSGLTLTPFEKNIEFWRQLWRVVERSDVLVQVLDARNPLLFISKDLQKYVKEVDKNKMNLIILNKADLLTEEQRKIWAKYFQENGIRAVFFSALQESARDEDQTNEKSDQKSEKNSENSDDSEENEETSNNETKTCEETDDKTNQDETQSETQEEESKVNRVEEVEEVIKNEEEIKAEENDKIDQENENEKNVAKEKEEEEESDLSESDFDGEYSDDDEYETMSSTTTSTVQHDRKKRNDTIDSDAFLEENWENSPELLKREELVQYFKTVYPDNRPKVKENYVTIGLIGYPNVGKSSTINALFQDKKVSISATPGKTKHFQTLFIDDDLCLCDCPGLVFPNFVSSKAEMVLNGILPIDQMKDHVPPVNLMISMIPAHIFETQYSIVLPQEVHKGKPLTAEQLLNAYGYMRGFMTQRGLPDNPRSSRYILKDFVSGKLLYCIAPPDYPQNEFHKFSDLQRPRPAHIPKKQEFLLKQDIPSPKDFDKSYFQVSGSRAHTKGPISVVSFSRAGAVANQESNSIEQINAKPWRKLSKRNTKQKLRKTFAHLDIK